MAKIHVQVIGGSIQEKEYDTLGELKKALGCDNYTASVNGEPENDNDYELSDFEFISLAPAVKGAY